eukprot:351119-Prorocentrum_minimum.AAC.1
MAFAPLGRFPKGAESSSDSEEEYSSESSSEEKDSSESFSAISSAISAPQCRAKRAKCYSLGLVVFKPRYLTPF